MPNSVTAVPPQLLWSPAWIQYWLLYHCTTILSVLTLIRRFYWTFSKIVYNLVAIGILEAVKTVSPKLFASHLCSFLLSSKSVRAVKKSWCLHSLIFHRSQFNVALCVVGGYPDSVFDKHCANESSITVQPSSCNSIRCFTYWSQWIGVKATASSFPRGRQAPSSCPS